MKRSSSAANKERWFILCGFCLLPFVGVAQNKAVIDKKPSTTLAHSKTIKAERVKKHKAAPRHIKKKGTPVHRAFDSPSQDDKKLREIKESKSRIRNGS